MTAGGRSDRHDPDYATARRRGGASDEPVVRVAVTGAGGLIGRPLVSALAGDDRVEEVVAVDLRAPARPPPAGVRVVRRDVRDPGLAADLAGIDALVHLAFRELDAGRAASVNVAGSRNAVEAAIGAGATAIVNASSGTVYGAAPDNPVPLPEDHPLRPPPDFAYPRAKVMVERMLDELAAGRPGVRVVHVRPTTVLGPGAGLLLARRAYVSLADFDPPLQFTWVDDMVRAFTAALHAPEAAGPFNVGAPGTVRASEVAGVLGVRGLRLPYAARRRVAAAMSRLRIPGALDPGFVDLARYPIVVSGARAERELGWQARLDTAGALGRFRETLS
jgi:UDP-glucose 4-epimerase